jgi:hypothetical protein
MPRNIGLRGYNAIFHKPLVKGDYVLATKYPDGDPRDHFFVGFFVGMLVDKDGNVTDRYLVDDGKGQLARANGFRRCERISNRVGHALCLIMPHIGDIPGRSVWWWRQHVSAMEAMAISFTAGDQGLQGNLGR